MAPIIIKAVLPLPNTAKKVENLQSDFGLTHEAITDESSSLGTQTDITGYEFLSPTVLGMSHDLSCDKMTKDVQTNSLALSEFGTQTPLLSDSWSQSFLHSRNDITDLFDTETIDFGTQTLDDINVITSQELGIQTHNFTRDQGSQT